MFALFWIKRWLKTYVLIKPCHNNVLVNKMGGHGVKKVEDPDLEGLFDNL